MKTRKNKKIKHITTAVIILILIGGGYTAYKYFEEIISRNTKISETHINNITNTNNTHKQFYAD